jgi:hypothetical protein
MNFINKGLFCGLSVFLFLYFNKKNNFLSLIAYQTMFYYSYLEIYIKKHVEIISNIPIVKNSIYKIKYIVFNDVELIKNNLVLNTCRLSDLIRYNPKYFDFFIYTDYKTSNKIVGKDVPIPLTVEKCDYRFYIMNVTVNNLVSENTFTIHLDNFYMVNNVINKYLICFLINRDYNVYVNPEVVKYTLEIMDNDMNYKSITEKEDIILKKDMYLVNNQYNEKRQIDLLQSDDKISDNIFKYDKLNTDDDLDDLDDF